MQTLHTPRRREQMRKFRLEGWDPLVVITIPLSPVLPSRHADCGSAHVWLQYTASMFRVLLIVHTVSASFSNRCKQPDNSYDPARKSSVRHTTDRSVWPPMVASLRQLWQHRDQCHSHNNMGSEKRR